MTVYSVADTGGGGGGGVPGVVTPPSGPSMNIIISRALFMNIILYPTCLFVSSSRAMKRSTSILAYFPVADPGGGGGGPGCLDPSLEPEYEYN